MAAARALIARPPRASICRAPRSTRSPLHLEDAPRAAAAGEGLRRGRGAGACDGRARRIAVVVVAAARGARDAAVARHEEGKSVRDQRRPHGLSSVSSSPHVRAGSRCSCSASAPARRRRCLRSSIRSSCRPLPYSGARSAGDAVGHERREGARPRSDLAGQLHGLSRAAGVHRTRRRGGVRASTSPIPARIRCASTRSRSSAQPVLDVLGVEPQVGAGLSDGGPFFVQNELIARDQRSPVADTATARDPSIVGTTARAERHAVHRRRRHAAEVPLPRRRRRLASGCGIPRQHSRSAPLHGSGRCACRTARRSSRRRAPSTALGRAAASRIPAHQQGLGIAASCRCCDEQLGYYRPALMVLFWRRRDLLLPDRQSSTIASLLLTRDASPRARRSPSASRSASTPLQLVTQLMAESVALSISGAAVGVAGAARRAAARSCSSRRSRSRGSTEAGVDLRALGLRPRWSPDHDGLFGLVPALLLLRRQVVDRAQSPA